jgi:hypothetical protein
LAQGIETSADRTKRDETSGKEYVSLSIAALSSGGISFMPISAGPLDRGRETQVVIWTPTDREGNATPPLRRQIAKRSGPRGPLKSGG